MEKLLVSGEFWHSDFADLISRVEVPTTLIPGDRLAGLTSTEERFSAILIAQSRRGSVSQTFINHVRRLFGDTPVIVLLGSWCEGETRSGQPLQNVVRMYWHEWNGSYNSLAARLGAQGILLPGTASRRPIDILRDVGREAPAAHAACNEVACVVGVSALTLCQFETLEDPLRALGATPIWLEQSTWRAADPGEIDAICLDCDGLNEVLQGRIELVREIAPNAPMVLTMNFPRKDEVHQLREQFDVRAVVSKPFDLHALWAALQSAGLELAEPAVTSFSSPAPAVSNYAIPS